MIDTATRTDLYAQESGETIFALLTIDHADLPEPIRISTNPTQRISTDPLAYGTVSRGQTYTFLPARVTLPDESDSSPARGRIEIDDINRSLTKVVRSIQGGATLVMEVVSSIDVDTPVRQIAAMEVRTTTRTVKTISLEVIGDPMLSEPFPGLYFTSDRYPGLF